MCRCRLRLSALCRSEPLEHEHLSHASNAIAAAFRLHQRWAQAAAAGLSAAAPTAMIASPDPMDVEAPSSDPMSIHQATAPELSADLVPTLQLLNFEVALRRHDPNAR